MAPFGTLTGKDPNPFNYYLACDYSTNTTLSDSAGLLLIPDEDDSLVLRKINIRHSSHLNILANISLRATERQCLQSLHNLSGGERI